MGVRVQQSAAVVDFATRMRLRPFSISPSHTTMHLANLYNDWIYCINSFRYSSPENPGCFVEDRDFSRDSYANAIANGNHRAGELALCVSMPLSNAFAVNTNKPGVPHKAPLRSYLDHLLEEIRLMGELVSDKRKVSYLHWQGDIPALLDSAEMTELMYAINKNFTLSHDNSGRYVVELSRFPEDESQIALIKGLGFNQVCLGVQKEDGSGTQPKELKALTTLLREYDFDAINLRYYYDMDCRKHNAHEQLQRLIEVEPDNICLINHKHWEFIKTGKPVPQKCACNSQLDQLLKTNGYNALNKVKYSRIKRTEPEQITDMIGLGLASTSLIDNIFAHNSDQLDQYFQHLDEQHLPFKYGGYVRPSA